MAPELFQVDAVLGCFFATDVNYWNVATEVRHERGVALNVNLAKRCVEFAQERSDCGLGFLAQVATNSAVQRHVWTKMKFCRPVGSSFWCCVAHE